MAASSKKPPISHEDVNSIFLNTTSLGKNSEPEKKKYC
jgi:hypothetical protein